MEKVEKGQGEFFCRALSRAIGNLLASHKENFRRVRRCIAVVAILHVGFQDREKLNNENVFNDSTWLLLHAGRSEKE